MSAISAGIPSRGSYYNMSKNDVPPGGAVTARGDNTLPELACSVRLTPFPRGTMQRYHTAHSPNVLKCIEVY